MSFSEFKKWLAADPLSREPATVRARQNGPEFEQAAVEEAAFEQKLSSALNFSLDKDALADEIIANAFTEQRRMPRWMAMAAGLVIVVGVAGILVNNMVQQPDTIEEYVEAHYDHDGRLLLTRADETVSQDKIRKIMASWDLEASPELAGRVTYIKKCFTMDGLGAHMVVRTDQGMLTLIVMPKTSVNDGQLIAFDEVEAHLVSLGGMSAAIIGRPGQPFDSVESLVRSGISKTS
ncbi:MAG: DUF3379 family protein [Xanthomonadales bacterium]|nr:DUF3379 family protein [Xanthomonadales bacterium]